MLNMSERPNIPFSRVLSEADRIIGYYCQYEADFAKRKTLRFTPGFRLALQENIARAHSILDDAAMRGQQNAATGKINELKKTFPLLQRDLYNYLDEIDSVRDSIKAEFGYGRLRDINKTAKAVLHFLDSLPSLFAKYDAQLKAINFPTSLKDSLGELREGLAVQIHLHDIAKDSRHTSTKGRKILIKSIYTDLEAIEEAAKIMFNDQPSIMLLFKFDKARHTRHSELKTTTSKTSITTTTTVTKEPIPKPVKPKKPKPVVITSTTTTSSSTTPNPAISPLAID